MLEDITLGTLGITLAILLLISGFFSIAETSMMASNRYRLRHLVAQGSKGAALAQALLDRTDKLLGVILLGNNLVNAASAVLTTLIAERLLGKDEITLAIATGAVTFLILVFSEITPKVIGATFPERIALPASYVLTPLLKAVYPVVWFVNLFVNGLLRIMGLKRQRDGEDITISLEELRTLVLEGGQFLQPKHRTILLNLLELEEITVDDVMVPRSQIEAIDITEPKDALRERIATAHHTRLLVYEERFENVVGLLHVRKTIGLMESDTLSAETLREVIRQPYFVPESTPLLTQLQHFQENQRGMALVVDEYGEVKGLVTLEDILEEIVGEFTLQSPAFQSFVHKQDDGSYIVEGACPLRLLNKRLGTRFPLDGPKTINGLLLEHFEDIPESGTSIRIADETLEIMQTQDRMVKSVRVYPSERRAAPLPAMQSA